MKIIIKSPVSKNFKFVFSKFDQALFEKLSPPLVKLKILKFDGCKVGDNVDLELSINTILPKMRWTSVITADAKNENEIYFIDEGSLLPFPLKKWKHIHRIEKIDEFNSVIYDDIEFSCNNTLIDYLMYPALYFSFSLRTQIYQKYFKD